MKKGLSIVSLLLVSALPVAALAEGPRAAFGDYDSNNDGKISQDEFKAGRTGKYQEAHDKGRHAGVLMRSSSRFPDLDADGDGYISKEEFASQSQGKAEGRRDRRKERAAQQGGE